MPVALQMILKRKMMKNLHRNFSTRKKNDLIQCLIHAISKNDPTVGMVIDILNELHPNPKFIKELGGAVITISGSLKEIFAVNELQESVDRADIEQVHAVLNEFEEHLKATKKRVTFVCEKAKIQSDRLRELSTNLQRMGLERDDANTNNRFLYNLHS